MMVEGEGLKGLGHELVFAIRNGRALRWFHLFKQALLNQVWVSSGSRGEWTVRSVRPPEALATLGASTSRTRSRGSHPEGRSGVEDAHSGLTAAGARAGSLFANILPTDSAEDPVQGPAAEAVFRRRDIGTTQCCGLPAD